MVTKYIQYLLDQATYETGETGVILSKISGYQGFYSQGDTFEKARENLKDAVEGVIAIKLSQKDTAMLADMKKFFTAENKRQKKIHMVQHAYA